MYTGTERNCPLPSTPATFVLPLPATYHMHTSQYTGKRHTIDHPFYRLTGLLGPLSFKRCGDIRRNLVDLRHTAMCGNIETCVKISTTKERYLNLCPERYVPVLPLLPSPTLLPCLNVQEACLLVLAGFQDSPVRCAWRKTSSPRPRETIAPSTRCHCCCPYRHHHRLCLCCCCRWILAFCCPSCPAVYCHHHHHHCCHCCPPSRPSL